MALRIIESEEREEAEEEMKASMKKPEPEPPRLLTPEEVLEMLDAD